MIRNVSRKEFHNTRAGYGNADSATTTFAKLQMCVMKSTEFSTCTYFCAETESGPVIFANSPHELSHQRDCVLLRSMHRKASSIFLLPVRVAKLFENKTLEHLQNQVIDLGISSQTKRIFGKAQNRTGPVYRQVNTRTELTALAC